jgi:hypothetical protein
MKVSAFEEVFRHKLEKLIKKIKIKNEVPKKERDKKLLRMLISEAKHLKKILKEND